MNNTWDIIPFERFGKLRFGMIRSSVRTMLGECFASFLKIQNTSIPTDAYEELGIHLYYNRKDKLEFIEAFPPCTPMYKDIALLGQYPYLVLNELAAMSHYVRHDNEAYFFDDLGFALYFPKGTTKIEAVSIYRKGYYDD